MQFKSDYVDQLFEFNGLWDTFSRCGIKIIHRDDLTYFIITELYTENPGTSVTDAIDKITTAICSKYSIDPGKLVVIEHTPDKGSKMDFYNEFFYHVRMEWKVDKFVNPSWELIPKEKVDEILKLYQ
jgi:hypothetical protein